MANHKELWQHCLEIIKSNIHETQFQSWFQPVESIGFENGVVTLRLPSDFFREQYEGRFFPILSKTMKRVYGANVRLQYTIEVVNKDPESAVIIESQTPSNIVRYEDIDSQLNLTYNFENYCVGNSNKLVHTIAEYIGNNPNKVDFNPVFLYGPTGVGKTHLIQAIGIRVKEVKPSARVLYITARVFENQYGQAVHDKKVTDFINFYQSIDVLLIDDIQEIAGKVGTQKDFFPIFNHLHQMCKQIIMTSDRPPVELDGIMERLINRFSWGVTEVLPKPDLELRKQIINQKSRKNGLALSEDVVELIAEYATDSVRELEGVIMSLITRASILNHPVTADLARVVMKSTVKITKKINFEMIVETTAAAYNFDSDVIFTKNRMRNIADARQVVMYLANKFTDLSSTMIGAKLGRTHATVLHGIKNVQNRIGVEKSFAEFIDQIETTLKKYR
ncbi:MAG: chromosomal replication initiator protein DnaA [Muribaculaceae bacterium]|nr:chromosomal replication initiator protein DnaA [Muribaculaceae bacterium]